MWLIKAAPKRIQAVGQPSAVMLARTAVISQAAIETLTTITATLPTPSQICVFSFHRKQDDLRRTLTPLHRSNIKSQDRKTMQNGN